MDSRSDGTLQTPLLFASNELQVNFSRYSASDPLCCPSRTTNVSYRIERRSGHFLVVPLDAITSPNGR